MSVFLSFKKERRLLFYFILKKNERILKICTFNLTICLKFGGFTSLHSTSEVPKQTLNYTRLNFVLIGVISNVELSMWVNIWIRYPFKDEMKFTLVPEKMGQLWLRKARRQVINGSCSIAHMWLWFSIFGFIHKMFRSVNEWIITYLIFSTFFISIKPLCVSLLTSYVYLSSFSFTKCLPNKISIKL